MPAPQSRLAASARTRLLLAALAWTAVGLGLLIAGAVWLLPAPPALVTSGAALALAAGWLKGRFLLARRAEANAQRIEAVPRQSVLAFIGPASWGLVLVMMAAGALLRRSALPRPWLGVLYAAVGIALLAGSAPAWRHWRRQTS